MPSRVNWTAVHGDDFRVPEHVPLVDLTAELTAMLGSTDPQLRDALAYRTLATWISRGIYDDLLPGLGDGMAAGLLEGLGRVDDDSVFRRSFSALIINCCIARDTQRPLVPGGKVLDWGDRVATWLLREVDVRGFVPGRGWAHAVAHGADVLGTLAESPHFGPPSSRCCSTSSPSGSRCRWITSSSTASPTGSRPRRSRSCVATGCPPTSSSSGWRRCSPSRRRRRRPMSLHRDPDLDRGNIEAFARALYVQLTLGPRLPPNRADLLLLLVEGLRELNPVLRAE